MDDEIRRLQDRLEKIAADCNKNRDDITALKTDMLTKTNSQDIRISEITGMTTALKEQVSISFARLEKSIEGLNKNQSDTSKEVTTVVTKLTIIFGVIMIVISAGLSKFLG